MADTPLSDSGAARREGSSPSTGTVWYALSAPDGTFVWGESNREGVDPLSPTAEATDLESVQCAFKSHRGYRC